MKNPLANAVLVSCLSLVCPAYAQESAPVPAAPAAPAMPNASASDALATPAPANAAPANQALDALQNNPLLQAYIAAAADLSPIFSQDVNKAKLDHLDGFEFSPATKKKFFDLFSNENPLHLKTSTLGNGDSELSIALDNLDYQDLKTGARAHSSALTGKATYSKNFTKAHTAASMPSFSFDDGKATQLTASDLSFATDQTRGLAKLWFGTGVFKLDHLALDNNKTAMHVKLDGMSVKSDIKQRGKLVDIDYDYAIKSINWGKDGVGPVHMAIRLLNIDGKEFAAVAEKAKKLDQSKQTSEERIANSTSMLKDFGLATLQHGGAIDIQDLSVQYHGMTAGLNGHIAFNKIQKADLESAKLVGEKINAHISLHIPMALVTDIARTFSRTTLEAQNKSGQPVTDQMVDAMAKGVIDKTMTKMLQDKWIRIEHDTIVSTIEYKMGKLSVNGQTVPVPASK